VGAFWMIRRVLRDGWKLDAAEEEAKKIGLKEVRISMSLPVDTLRSTKSNAQL
jgi:hypothetical protein